MKIPTIKREVEGEVREFELTVEECLAAYWWTQHNDDIEDCCSYIYQNKGDDSDVDDEIIDAMVEMYREHRDLGFSEEFALEEAYDYYFRD